MPSPVVIGLDLGTTSCKAVAVAADGDILSSTSHTNLMQATQPGWAELRVDDVWEGVLSVLRATAANVPRARIAGIALSGAMHSLLPVVTRGKQPAFAMTWADNRAAEQAKELAALPEAWALYQRSGCPPQPAYNVARLRWWRVHAPEIFRSAERFVAIKDWVLFKLTDVWATDTGLASTTGLLDIHRLAWDSQALEFAGVTSDQLPPLAPPESIAGRLTESIASATGLAAGLPVVAGGTDGGLANLGAGAVAPGDGVITVGTSGAVRHIVDAPLLDPQGRTWCYVLTAGRWFAGGAINNAGLALRWAQGMFYPDIDRDKGQARMLADAAMVAVDTTSPYLLPYLTGERSPHWNADASATLHGLTLSHGRADVVRAVLEGVAFCLADVWDALGRPPREPVLLTGGITESPLWAQILADVLKARLALVDVADASAIGAASLGHWGLGHMAALEPVASATKSGPVLEPDLELHALYARRRRVFQRLYRAVCAVDEVNSEGDAGHGQES